MAINPVMMQAELDLAKLKEEKAYAMAAMQANTPGYGSISGTGITTTGGIGVWPTHGGQISSSTNITGPWTIGASSPATSGWYYMPTPLEMATTTHENTLIAFICYRFSHLKHMKVHIVDVETPEIEVSIRPTKRDRAMLLPLSEVLSHEFYLKMQLIKD